MEPESFYYILIEVHIQLCTICNASGGSDVNDFCLIDIVSQRQIKLR